MDVWRLGQAGGALPHTFSFPAPAGPPDGGPLLFLRAWAFGDGEGDGFVGGVGFFWEVYRVGHICKTDEFYFGDVIRSEGVGGLAGLAFFPNAEEDVSGLGVSPKAIGMGKTIYAVIGDNDRVSAFDDGGERVERLHVLQDGSYGLGLPFFDGEFFLFRFIVSLENPWEGEVNH